MATPLRQPTHRLFLILSITVYLTCADTFTLTADGPSDVEVNNKCGFLLSDIYNCKYHKCQESSAICAAKTPGAQGGDLIDCQINICMDEKKICEEPLNKYLSKEEQCEGDAFNEVEKNCLITSRTSQDQLIACKRDGYLEKKVHCFEAEWKRRIKAYAKNELGKTASQKAIDCAYQTCFENVTRCLRDHHYELAINPASKRKFDLDHCAYVAVNYSHECESVPRLTGCVEKLIVCISNNTDNTPQIIGGVLGTLGALVVVIVFVVRYNKKSEGATNTPQTTQATGPQPTNQQETNLQATNAPDINVHDNEVSQLLENTQDPKA